MHYKKIVDIEAMRKFYRGLDTAELVRSDMLLVLHELEITRVALENAAAESGQSGEGTWIDDRTADQVIEAFAKDGVVFRYV